MDLKKQCCEAGSFTVYADLAPAPIKNFDAAPVPTPTLLYSKPDFLKQTILNKSTMAIFSGDFFVLKLPYTVNINRERCYSM
jgi:hypothetical protein